MRRKVQFLLFLFLCLTSIPLAAQNIEVKGMVTEAATNEPLPGVTVRVKGKDAGTVTSMDGKFTVKVNKGDILVFSTIGMKSIERTISSNAPINVSMEEDNVALEQVVVIGYGTVKKRDLTGAVASVKSEDITMNPGVNPMDALRSVRELRGVKPAYCRMSGQAVNFNMGDTPPLRCGLHSMRRTNASSTGSLMRVSLLMKKR